MAPFVVDHNNNMFLFLAIVLTSWACMAMAQGGGGGGNQPSCVQKLLPCQPYLHGTTEPPAVCCLPLNQLIDGDTQCLCAIINDEALLKTFNVTKDDAMELPKRCGATADLGKCNSGGAPPPSGSSVASPPPPATPAPPEDASSAAGAYGKKTVIGVALALTVGWTSVAALVF